MLQRVFCWKLFALGDVQANADTFYDTSLLSLLIFHRHMAIVSHLQKLGFLKMLCKVDTLDVARNH